ncbi:hypothetical protein D3C83_78790 [compost metagenome]
MTGIEIVAEERVLLRRGVGGNFGPDHVRVAPLDAQEAARRGEIPHHDPHRNAGAASLAGRPVGDVLAAPEAALGQHIVQRGRPLADKVREHLPLFLAG